MVEKYIPQEAYPPEEREVDPTQGRELLKYRDISVILPEKPWMPTHAGVELRIVHPLCSTLVTKEKTKPENLISDLKEIGKTAIIAATVEETFSEADDPKNPDWYDKPWFNLNINSHLQREKLNKFTCQVYLRPRTMGQMRELKLRRDYEKEESDSWSNPYWTTPIPVDYPLNPDDRGPYESKLQDKVEDQLKRQFQEKGPLIKRSLSKMKLFTEPDGSSSLEKDFPFKIRPGDYPVWQKGDYLLVTQANPLVGRKDGLHLVLIYRGEQQGEEERFSFHWRDPRRIAEIAIIAAATSKVITENGYSGNKFDKSYIHLNANWSLDYALPVEERHEIMDFGSVGPGQWPGPKESQTVPGPNAHPHIQILKPECDLDIPPSAKWHAEHPRERQTDVEIEALKTLLKEKLTPIIESLQGKTLEELKNGQA